MPSLVEVERVGESISQIRYALPGQIVSVINEIMPTVLLVCCDMNDICTDVYESPAPANLKRSMPVKEVAALCCASEYLIKSLRCNEEWWYGNASDTHLLIRHILTMDRN